MIKPIENYQGLNITFQVTEDCNLACVYCYEVDKKPKELEFEYAKMFIDILLTDPDPIGVLGTDLDWILKQGLIIDFIGGDALMCPELCDKILTYFQYKAYELNHRWKDRWRCSISTNGTLLGKPEVQKFLLKYKENISLGISMDGCPEMHDKNRVFKGGGGTMSTIMQNWGFYKSYMGEAASTKATLNKTSIPYLFESVKFLHETLELKQINMNFIFEDMQLSKEDYIAIDEQLNKVVPYILNHCDDMHLNMLGENFGIGNDVEYSKYNIKEDYLQTGWCGAGSMPCLSVNGKIYPCFRFTPNTMHNREEQDHHVGDVWNGFNKKENFQVIRDQTREKISPKECFSCPTESSCSWCIGGAFSEKGVFYRTTNLCGIHKLIDKHARNYWNQYNKLKGIDKTYDEPVYPEECLNCKECGI